MQAQRGADAGIETGIGDEQILWRATFAPVTAWALAAGWSSVLWIGLVVLSLPFVLFAPCFAVPLAIVVAGLGAAGLLGLARRYVASLRCVLTTRSLRASGGVLTKWERAVPLDKVTDLAVSQGLVSRWFNVEHLSIETAGGASAGATVHLYGLENPREFRRAVLEQRDRVVGTAEGLGATAAQPRAAAGLDPEDIAVHDLLREIRDEVRALREDLRGRP